MSDPQNPYGQPDPYGQQSPYGQQNPYEQQNPYGQPTGYGYGQPAPERRPGTVTAAGVTTIILSALVALLFAFLTAGLLVARDQIATEIDRELAGQAGLEGFSADDVTSIGIVVCLVFLVWSVAGIVLAVLAMRRAGWARVLLVVSSAITAVLSLLLIGSLISVVWLIASIAVIVLLFTGGANQWYAAKGR